jgi:hypothetical protein
LDRGARLEFRFVFVSHRKRKASQIEHWLALPRVPNWLAVGLAGYRFCFWLSSRALRWFVQEKLSLFCPEQKVDFRFVLGFELDHDRQVFRFQFQ